MQLLKLSSVSFLVACGALSAAPLAAQEDPTDWPAELEVVNHPQGRQHDGAYFRDLGTINGAPYYSHVNAKESPDSRYRFDYLYRVVDLRDPSGLSFAWGFQGTTPHPARFEGAARTKAAKPWEGGWDHPPLQVKPVEVERSRDIDPTPIMVTFSNPLGETVDVVWVDQKGDEYDHDKLAPGESYQQESRADHYWKFFVGETQVGSYRTTRARRQSYAIGAEEDRLPAGVGVDSPLLETVRVRLNNGRRNELGLLLVDNRTPAEPLPVKIEPEGSTMIDLRLPVDRAGDPTALYEMSVYELAVTSTSIDRSGRGGPTTETITPRSIGHFAIPSGKMNPGTEIDVYASARKYNNPGGVVRIDPAIWTRTTTRPTLPTPPVPPPVRPPEPPPVEPPTEPPLREWSELFVPSDLAESGVFSTGIDCALAQIGADGELTLQRTIWEEVAENYTVSVPYTEEIEQTYTVGGEEQTRTVTITKTREETRTRIKRVPKMVAEPLPADKFRCFSASGRQLPAKETPLVFRQPGPAIVLRATATLDRAYLDLLEPSAKIILDDRTEEEARSLQAAPQKLNDRLPEWPLFYVAAQLGADGSLRVVYPQLVPEEKTVAYTEMIPITEQQGGRTVTKFVPEQRTKIITAIKRVPQVGQLPKDAYRAYQMSGKRLKGESLAAELGKQRPIVYIKPGDKISRSFHGALLRDDCIVVIDRREPGEALPLQPETPQ